ncbi:MAG: hypothetical protein AAGI46_13915 [Planctomycetota bacterium]
MNATSPSLLVARLLIAAAASAFVSAQASGQLSADTSGELASTESDGDEPVITPTPLGTAAGQGGIGIAYAPYIESTTSSDYTDAGSLFFRFGLVENRVSRRHYGFGEVRLTSASLEGSGPNRSSRLRVIDVSSNSVSTPLDDGFGLIYGGGVGFSWIEQTVDRVDGRDLNESTLGLLIRGIFGGTYRFSNQSEITLGVDLNVVAGDFDDLADDSTDIGLLVTPSVTLQFEYRF